MARTVSTCSSRFLIFSLATLNSFSSLAFSALRSESSVCERDGVALVGVWVGSETKAATGGGTTAGAGTGVETLYDLVGAIGEEAGGAETGV